MIVALVLALLNYLAVRHHRRIDMSSQGSFTLSEQTQKILASLPREVQVRAYYYGGTLAEQKMKDLNCDTVEAAMKMIEGSARSMGLTVTE